MSDIKGLVYNFEIYMGKILPVSGHPNLGASSDIVLQLVEIVKKNANHSLYCDNSFSFLPLFVELAKSGIYAVGAIRYKMFQGCTFSSDASLKKKGRSFHEKKEATIENILIRAVN